MDSGQKERRVKRNIFTRTANKLSALIESGKIDEIKCEFNKLKNYSLQLIQLDDKIKNLMLEDKDLSEDDLEKEFISAETYLDTYRNLEIAYNSIVEQKETKYRNFKLPEIKLVKFNGNIKDWLSFWGQFKKIDNDPNIDDDDKYIYLLQSMEPHSEVYSLINSYPSTGTSYKQCLEELKQRYGRQELLIEIYVREILALILNKKHILTDLYDQLNSNLRSLESLGVAKYTAFILPLVESALPIETLKIWERTKGSVVKDNCGAEEILPKLMEFLKAEVNSMQRIEIAQKTFNTKEQALEPSTACFVATSSNEKKCIWCDRNTHASIECCKLFKLSLEERKEHLKSKKACTICLRVGHFAKFCKAYYIKCHVCAKRHSVVMCPNIQGLTKNQEVQEKISKPHTTTNLSSLAGQTLLQTIIINICNKGKKIPIRALFDSGSQKSYVAEHLIEKLNIKPTGMQKLSHSLFGNVNISLKTYNVYSLEIESLDRKFKTEIEVLSQPQICGYIPKLSLNNNEIFNYLKIHDITLTDVNYDNLEIELLIGADFAGLLMTDGIIHLDNGMVALKTKLGWTIQGKEIYKTFDNVVTSMLCCSEIGLEEYWSLETLGIRDPVEIETKEQKEAEIMSSFKSGLQIREDGRYEVRLPFKVGHEDLLPNYKKAKKRLDSVTKKLISTGMFDNYHAIFKEWLASGIIEIIPHPSKYDHGHYLSHKAVIKDSSLTTKIRPVFDASAQDDKGLSLNMCLDKGVNFIDRIPNLLVKFRKRAIGVVADIAKAFLQIFVNSDDRDFLKFLWWEDASLNQVVEYRHCRVVFGLTSSPFLLMATIIHHLNNIKIYQETAEILKYSWYVDNCVTSIESEKDTHRFIAESKYIMSEAKFDLRMWVTSPLKINEYGREVVPVLGLNWETATDELTCNFTNLPPITEIFKITKRLVLSITQRIFDPIGLTSAVMLLPKLLLQKTWYQKLRWDEQLPNELAKEFLKWYENIDYLRKCKIPRRITVHNIDLCKLSMHLFTDASKNAMAACIFLRAENDDGQISLKLLVAKSRVAPLKNISIPRLELMAVVIGSRLLVETRKSLELTNCEEFYWTDSSVALYWICKDLVWNKFVGNRVTEIKKNTSKHGNWRHISGSLNWADLLSRGCDAKHFIESKWIEGPSFLLKTQEKWPNTILVADEGEASKELKKLNKIKCNISLSESILNKLQYFSKYTKIVRMVAWMLRFTNKCRKNKIDISSSGDISNEEFEKAEMLIIKLIQNENKGLLEKQTKNLNTFHDSHGILRIKTKLVLANVEENVKYPIVVSAKNRIIEAMVKQRHVKLLHAGINVLITDVRKTFWVLGIRRLVKSVIYECLRCKIYRAKQYQAPVAPLPMERIDSAAPFNHSGVDLAGPLYLKNGEKCWVVLYTCAVFRAVHLELTLSLSTEAFIRTFRRFIARRGRVLVMYSDNGTNFVGTKNLLDNIDWDEVQKETCLEKVKWKLNVPTGSWWGGFFERLIRLMKELLRKVLGKASVQYDELQTLLCECESVMNNRPLTYVQDDKAECLEPLTPSCFLLPLKSSETTDLDLIDAASLNKRLKYMKKLKDDFRQRFKSEYLTTLIQKGKDKAKYQEVQIGQVVLIENEYKRVKWPLGIIHKIFQGKDGISRTVEVKTSSGFKTRPIQKL